MRVALGLEITQNKRKDLCMRKSDWVRTGSGEVDFSRAKLARSQQSGGDVSKALKHAAAHADWAEL